MLLNAAPLLQRLHRLSARLLPYPRLRRALLWLACAAWFGFATLFLGLRYLVLPHVPEYRQQIEQALSAAIKLPVSIARIDADWHGFRPRLVLHGFALKDKEGREALRLEEVDAVPGWVSLLHFELRLHRLEIIAPNLNLRRDKNGVIYVAGIKLDAQNQDSGFADWVLAQHDISVRNASIVWQDELRGAPSLTLQDVNLHLQNSGQRHRFGLTALPPAAMADKIDVRGDLRGKDLSALKEWRGELYAALNYADLAVWQTWIDYPLELPQGRGGLHLWLNLANGQLSGLHANVRLDGVEIRLAHDLPLLQLQHLAGQIGYKRDTGGETFSGTQLGLTTQDGLAIAPTDFALQWSRADNGQFRRADFTASQVDLLTLRRFIDYLPLAKELRAQIEAADARGHLQHVHLGWRGAEREGKLATDGFILKAAFSGLSLAPQGLLPGFHNLSGEVDGDEESGRLDLDAQHAVLQMPRVFPEPNLNFSALEARLKWRRKSEGTLFTLEKASFQNADTHGTASGRYQSKAGSAGEIDLEAKLLATDGRAVWRYLPLVVNKTARDWVRAGILGGVAEEARLTLRGDLDKFPFRDGSGLFQVLAHCRNVSLAPAAGWPAIDKIDGELDFTGARMLVTAKHAAIQGASLANVTAEIPDLESNDSVLRINGSASGPTAEFLKYIDASPIAKRINNFTSGMTASGNGALQLKLDMPLQHVADTKVEGSFHFLDNRLSVYSGFPLLSELNARLDFTESAMTARDARANFLGMPLVANIVTEQDGTLRIGGEGGATAAALRRQYGLALFDHLSGSARWRGTLRIKGGELSGQLDSDLVGIASSLPEPFNKSTNVPMRLRFERKPVPLAAVRGKRAGPRPAPMLMDDLALGTGLRAQLLSRSDAKGMRIERGLIALGNVKRKLPERGVLLALDQPRLNLDEWRALLAADAGQDAVAAAPTPVLTEIDLRAAEVRVFNRGFHDVALNGRLAGQTWRTRLKARELSANLDWKPGNGTTPAQLSGHVPQLNLPEEAEDAPPPAVSKDSLRQMPTLALTVDSLRRGGRDLGALRIDADTKNDRWNASFALNNEDGNLSGSGYWDPDPAVNRTQLDFSLKAKSVEKLLARFGYADAIRRGSAALHGSLSWNGAPQALHYASLTGKIRLDAKDGQFNKIEPGIGRLLGVLSLQSLPRRITLDFNDIFSSGFAFDSIEGDVAIERGIMQTGNFSIAGPAAKIRMQGRVDLQQETQDLTVRVQPAVGTSLATGVLLLHPVAGAVAWAAQKLLKDPVDQAFAFSYAVTGSWSDPKVNKLSENKDEKKSENK